MERKKPGKVGENKSEVVREVPKACADELAAVEFMEKRRWGDTPYCPCCGSVDVYKMKNRKTGEREANFRWRCRDCGSLYSVRKGTVFEDSRIPLRHWCFAFWAACSSKKGVSAKQIQRQTGLSYKSALFLMHRIRYAMQPDHSGKLTGTVEADETYVGGKPRYRGKNKRGRGTKKVPVAAVVQRNGDVRTRVIQRVNAANLKGMVRDHVDSAARVITDDFGAYKGLGPEFPGGHHTVHHGRGEYARGDIHSNTIEGFFSLVKRGMYGTYHAVSKEHLHRYLGEFEYRYNTRKLDDGDRTAIAIKQAEGRRLRYRKAED